jgi:hypothetical protein
MSLLTQASPFNTIEGKPPEKMKSNMIDTFKRIQSEHLNTTNDALVRSSKIEQSQAIENNNKLQLGNDGDRLADFVIPPSYQSKSVGDARQAPVYYNNGNVKNNGSSFSQSYGTTPYFAAKEPTNHIVTNSSNHLMEKLNYMIHLLEEQQKEPTQNIMEEFALYGLLGVFMIYIVDSFARVGKYTR